MLSVGDRRRSEATTRTRWDLRALAASGYCPQFGLYRVDYGTPDRTRVATDAVAVLRTIIDEGLVSSDLVATHAPYATPVLCE